MPAVLQYLHATTGLLFQYDNTRQGKSNKFRKFITNLNTLWTQAMLTRCPADNADDNDNHVIVNCY